MSRTYSRDDVQTHSDGYRARRPAVNVKVWPSYGLTKVDAGALEGDTDAYLAWLRAWVDANENDANEWWTLACEDGWDDAQQDADIVFGEGAVKVFSEGRMGGWCVVDGLPELESWDAVALGRWRRFERYVKSIRDDTETRFASLVQLNVYEPLMEDEDEIAQQLY